MKALRSRYDHGQMQVGRGTGCALESWKPLDGLICDRERNAGERWPTGQSKARHLIDFREPGNDQGRSRARPMDEVPSDHTDGIRLSRSCCRPVLLDVMSLRQRVDERELSPLFGLSYLRVDASQVSRQECVVCTYVMRRRYNFRDRQRWTLLPRPLVLRPRDKPCSSSGRNRYYVARRGRASQNHTAFVTRRRRTTPIGA